MTCPACLVRAFTCARYNISQWHAGCIYYDYTIARSVHGIAISTTNVHITKRTDQWNAKAVYANEQSLNNSALECQMGKI